MSTERSWLWFVLAVVSALLQVASLTTLWGSVLIFFAIVPFVLFLEREDSLRRIGAGAFIVGALPALTLAYWSTWRFHWLPEAHIFETLMKMSSIFIALAIGAVFGIAFALYARYLKTPSRLYNILTIASIWTLIEIFFTHILFGYNFGILAYAVSGTPLVSLAAVGGVHFVSFIILVTGGLIAALVEKRERNTMIASVAFVIFISALWCGSAWYLRYGEASKSLAVAVIQNQDRQDGAFGSFDKGEFTFSKVSDAVRESQAAKADIVIYPFSLSREVLAVGTSTSDGVAIAPLEAVSSWEGEIASSTLFVGWNTVLRGNDFYNEIGYWQSGAVVGEYHKRHLLPFIDYTPEQMQHYGFFTTVLDETAGSDNQRSIRSGDTAIASAVCSEVSDARVVRGNADGADLLLSIGSDAIFKGDFVGRFDLASAQFRAAENNIPIVRANRFGPSASIDSGGRVISLMTDNDDGVHTMSVEYGSERRRTLYERMPHLMAWLGGILIVYAFLRRRVSVDVRHHGAVGGDQW